LEVAAGPGLATQEEPELKSCVLVYTQELADKVAELEATAGKHDMAIGGIIETLREMILSPGKDKRKIGF
jgi:hypothetical protein